MRNMWRFVFSLRNVISFIIYLCFFVLLWLNMSSNDDLIKKNARLMKEIKELQMKLVTCKDRTVEPSLVYEKTRRKLSENINFFWDYFKFALDNLKEMAPQLMDRISELLKNIREYKITWLNDLETLSRNDGYDSWRRSEANQLRKIIAERIELIQNPLDCEKAKIFKCYAYPEIGWGGILHEIAKCLTIAYSLNRTMIFNSTDLQYTNKAGMGGILEPLSYTCTSTPPREIEYKWLGLNNNNKRILFLNRDNRDTANLVVRRVPSDLADRIHKLTNDPLAWWYGQLIASTIKYSPDINKMLKESETKSGFKRPIAGIHVRRTDKLKYNKPQKIEEYMSFVEEFYDRLVLKGTVLEKRRIYLATEDPNVVYEVKQRYPAYEILSNIEAAKIASQLKNRWSVDGLKGIITDIYMLSMSDFVVCTFSSNICLLLLEHFHSKYPDASTKLMSLDRLYWADYKSTRFFVAIQNHTVKQNREIPVMVGDRLKVKVNRRKNGYFFVTNIRTDQSGFVPGFKIELIIETFESPFP